MKGGEEGSLALPGEASSLRSQRERGYLKGCVRMRHSVSEANLRREKVEK
jgi:hypothetical protein